MLKAYTLTYRDGKKGREVYDVLRRKFLAHTPEEEVRQQFLHWLLADGGYPAALLAVERGLTYNGRTKRFDLLAYDRKGQPLLIVECKSPQMRLTQSVLTQLAVYNSRFAAPHLLITNGVEQYCFSRQSSGGFILREEPPTFTSLLAALDE